MKFITKLSLLFCLLITLTVTSSKAQCVIDSSQTQPGLHPDSLLAATVNQYYTQDITFVLITDTLGLTISNFLIQSINGLPLGLQWSCNHASNGCNYDPAQSIYGCVRFYGTPLLAGTYPLSVTVVATVAFIGNQTFNFNTQLVVQPASNTNNSFSMLNSSGCAPLSVSFTNNLPNGDYYHWNFGNGDTSLLENPPPVTFTQPGDYVVTQLSIADTTASYFLTSVKIDSIPNNAGVIDVPDIYILIKNQSGTTVFDSHPSYTNTNPPLTIAIPALQLNNENYTVEVWDEDSGLSAPDDPLGTITFSGIDSTDTAYATLSGISGRLKLIYSILRIAPQSIFASDTIHVYPSLAAPTVTASGALAFCDGDTVILNSNYSGLNQWFNNGNLLVGETDSLLEVVSSGNYLNIATNQFGCSDTSNVVPVQVFLPPPYPNFSIVGSLLTANVFGTFTYAWLLNDTVISGANQASYTALVSGFYRLQITDTNGCTRTSFPISIVLTNVRNLSQDASMHIYPNPAQSEVVIEANSSSIKRIDIKNSLGQLVYSISKSNQTANISHKIQISSWQKGIYFVECYSDQLMEVRKLVVE
ncbi:MAG TPA: T9SS type A sorting domain-containing protein [Bacteroidia bacterium]|nr:T9SS type A sorting domain-containing protein [Bacteroidia bacterium]